MAKDGGLGRKSAFQRAIGIAAEDGSDRLLGMQTYRPAVVPLLSVLMLCAFRCVNAGGEPPKPHTVVLGAVRKVPYTPPEARPDDTSEEATTLKVRPLLVDGAQKEWTVGETHEVTERTFVVRRALRLNDALPGETPRWSWQPGPWLTVDRTTGRVTALHLPAFDPQVSDVVWFRDYAAYCGIATTVKGGLVAVVAELGARRAVVQKVIGPWPQANAAHPVCARATWQRVPMRATLQATGGPAMTFDVVGTSSLVEDGDEGDPSPAP
jgi:hypothetical protein